VTSWIWISSREEEERSLASQALKICFCKASFRFSNSISSSARSLLVASMSCIMSTEMSPRLQYSEIGKRVGGIERGRGTHH
jgi:hypothetical protein